MKRCFAPRMPISMLRLATVPAQHDQAGGVPRLHHAGSRRLRLIDQVGVVRVVFRQGRIPRVFRYAAKPKRSGTESWRATFSLQPTPSRGG